MPPHPRIAHQLICCRCLGLLGDSFVLWGVALFPVTCACPKDALRGRDPIKCSGGVRGQSELVLAARLASRSAPPAMEVLYDLGNVSILGTQ